MEGRGVEQISVQLEVVAAAERLNSPLELADAWNTLAAIYQQAEQNDLAEDAARKSMTFHDPNQDHAEERLATYEFLLATILGALEQYDEAVDVGESAISHFEVFHDPPTEFLGYRKRDVEKMRALRDGA